MIFGKDTKKKWVGAVIWSVIFCFVASIFVIGASFTWQLSQNAKAKKENTENESNREPDYGSFTKTDLSAAVSEVNKDKITFKDYYDEYKSIPAQYKTALRLNSMDGKLELLKRIENSRLIRQKAAEMNITVSDEKTLERIEMNYRRAGQAIDKKLLMQKINTGDSTLVKWFDEQKIPVLVEELVKTMTGAVSVSQEEIEKYYLENKNSFKKTVTENGKSVENQLGLDEVDSDIRGILEQKKIADSGYKFYEAHPEMFREQQKKEIAHIFFSKKSAPRQEQIREKLTEDEITAYYNMHQREFLSAKQVSLNHILLKFSSDKYRNVTVDTDEIKAHYEAHAGEYQYPEKMRALHILLSPDEKKHRNEIQIDNGRIAKYYEENKLRYLEPEKVHAQHILLSDEQKAGEIYQKLQDGGDFAALAKEFSKDPGSAVNGGDLGFFSRGEMVGPFEEASFKAEINTIVPPVKTQFGYHVIRVVEKSPEHYKPLAEVTKDITEELLDQEVRTALSQKSEKIRAEILNGDEFSAVAVKHSDAPSRDNKGTIGFFSRGRQIEGTEESLRKEGILEGNNLDQEIENVLFKMEAGDISPVIETATGYHIFKVMEKIESRQMPLNEVADKVRDRIVTEKVKKKTLEKADELIDKIRNGADIAALAKEFSDAQSASRGGETGYIPQGELPENFDSSMIDSYWLSGKRLQYNIGNEIFAMKDGEVKKVELREGIEVLKVSGILPPDVLPLSEARQALTEKLTAEKVAWECRRKAEDARKRLGEGVDFAVLAAEGDGKTAAAGGILGMISDEGTVNEEDEKNFRDEAGTTGYTYVNGSFRFGLNLDPQFLLTVSLMDAGETSDVVETELGYHIIKAHKVEKGQIKPYNEVASDIAEIMNVTVGEQEIRKFYEENKSQYLEPEKVRLYNILLKDEETALKVRSLLQKGEDFKTLAGKFSVDGSGGNSGLIGDVSRGKLPEELENAAFSMEIGKFSDVIKSPYGYHLLMVENKIPERTATIDEKRAEISEQILSPRRDKAFEYWLKEARNQAEIKMEKALINNLFKRI